jgi:uncharacterized protein YuzE
MAEVKVFYDEIGSTLTIWFGDPNQEYICEETGDEVILMKDRAGHVIGIEKLNVSVHELAHARATFEMLPRMGT